jgi:hypothetical protein
VTAIDGLGVARCVYLGAGSSIVGFTLANGLASEGGGVRWVRVDDRLHVGSFFVDRQVNEALNNLLDTANPGLIRLLRRASRDLSAKQISDSILRHRTQIELPPVWNATKNPPKPRGPRCP